ncbi:ComEC/Rec2 family competence protein [Clavibacter sp. Sh2126]|uniref:ComEC/Rec2 family competence protein n=1 Tax=Clavibacter sp. Sh2126 TaxID=3397678 RepID=UPI0039E1ECFE
MLRGAAGLAVAAGVAAMLLGAAAAREPLRHPVELEAAAAAAGMVVADVVLDESPAPVAGRASGASAAPARVRIVGRLRVIHVGGQAPGRAADVTVTPSAPVPVVVFAPAAAVGGARPGVGSTIRLTAAVRAAEAGDQAAYLLLARGGLEQIARPDGPLAVADGLRRELTRAASELPGPGARLLPGLAIGDVSAVPAELAQTMKDTSLTHLTAVSGANCAVIVGIVLALAAAVGLRRPARAVAAVGALAAFVVLVTPQPSVLRAAVMAAVLIVSTVTGRPSRGLPALALAVVILLVGDPWLARDLGFALSVLATAGLLVLAPPLADRLARGMPRRLAEGLAVPVAAQVACQPVLLVLQPGLPVHGVLANLLAEPAAAPATVAGLAACVLLPIWPAAGGLALRLAWLPSSWIAAVARVMSELPWGRVPWPTGPGGVVALTLASALAVAALALGRGPGERRAGTAVTPGPAPPAAPSSAGPPPVHGVRPGTADVPPDG